MNSYDIDKLCMSFTNEEIEEYFIKPLSAYSNLTFRMLNSEGIELCGNSDESIIFVCFDGKKENFYIRFYNHLTSIFISDEESIPERKWTFNEEFMFLDDDVRQNYTSSDTSGNVVYGGPLKNKTHKELLKLFCEIIILLNGAKSISIEEAFVSQESNEYPKYNYTVKICNETNTRKKLKYENILFLVNETV